VTTPTPTKLRHETIIDMMEGWIAETNPKLVSANDWVVVYETGTDIEGVKLTVFNPNREMAPQRGIVDGTFYPTMSRARAVAMFHGYLMVYEGGR
jgi:hypothetical protein